jgi:carbamoyltransferase
MSVILGISCYHPDAAACVVIGGKVMSAISEERLGHRIKHMGGFPHHAIRFVLEQSQCGIDDIEHIAVARDPRANMLSRGKRYLSVNGFRQALSRLKYSSDALNSDLERLIQKSKRKNQPQLHFVEHHLAHIASSYFTSPYDSNVTAFSYDGSGDGVSCAWAKCEGAHIKIQSRDYIPNSLGHFYTALCQIIGFNKYGEEYKVMGLAPYGEPTYLEQLSKVITVDGEGFIKLSSEYIDTSSVDTNSNNHLPNFFTSSLLNLLELSGPLSRSSISQDHKDIARSTQATFENCVLSLISKRNNGSAIKNFITAGGCALNGVTNSKIQGDLGITNHFIHPASSDDGTSLGAALYVAHSKLNEPRDAAVFLPYLGGKYDTFSHRAELDRRGAYYFHMQDFSKASKLVAYLISQDLVIGYFNERSEWGPRALGNRSILANPLCKDMKDIINSKIKKRESFRPFAPSVLAEDAKLYFEQDLQSPYMMHVVKFKEKYRKMFPCVTHADFTGRLQTVSKDLNPKYYSIISNFKDITGYGIVLNTSFNENEPIVETPDQALACYDRTDIDALFVNDTIVYKDKKYFELSKSYLEKIS